jgi:hypothetical protein
LFANTSAALGYVNRYGRPMEQGEFNLLASFFYGHATLGATDSIALGPLGPLDDEALSERLGFAPFLDPKDEVAAGRQLEENINYIGALLADRVGRRVFAGTLANWREWALGARAYARMLIEQPSNAPKAVDGDDRRRAEIAAAGLQLRNELLELSRDRAVFDTFTQRHRMQVNALLTRLGEARDAWYAANVPAALLLGGIKQAPPLTLPAGIKGCDTGTSTLTRPDALTAEGQVAGPVRLAAKLNVATVELCWRAAQESITGPSLPGAGRVKKATVAVTVEAHTKLKDEPTSVAIGRRTIRIPDVEICWSEQIQPDPDRPGRWVWRCDEPEPSAHAVWAEAAARFEREATAAAVDDPQARDAAITRAKGKARDELDRLQRDLRVTLLSQLTDRVSRPPVHRAALAASGAKALLRDTVALGLPQAIAYDDLLHALLDGDQAILDLDGVARELVVPATAGLFPDQRDVDPVAALGDLAAARADRLDGVLARWHDLIASGTHQERHAVIEDTLDELEAARVVAYE